MKFKSDIEVQAGLKDSSGSNGSSGQVLSSDGATVSWVNAGSSVASDVQNEVKAGVAINKGQAVYVTGADGTNIIVGLASNTSEATSSKTLGLLNATVAVNGFADVVQIGKLSGLNTIGANVGDPVWLGTNGNLIYGLANKPYAPAHLVFIGIVTRVNANNGEIFVTVQNGFELKEIHDVDIITNVPINGDVLGYDGTLWVNKTIAEWLGYTPVPNTRALTINGNTQNLTADRTWTIDIGINGSGTVNTLSKFTGTTTIGDSQIKDSGTSVSIGYTTNPNSYKLDVNGDVNINTDLYVSGTFPYTIKAAGGVNVDDALGVYWKTDVGGIGGTLAGIGQSSSGLDFYTNSSFLAPKLRILANGNVTIGTLAGSGSRMVVADATGVLSTQAIPPSGVTSFNTRTGAITLTSGDVTTALGYTPVTEARTITINGVTQDLTVNRSWTVTAPETDTLATVVARGDITAGGRPIRLDTSGGGVSIRGSVGGWATGYYFMGSSNTYRGGFGALGDSDGLSNYWIGPAYNNYYTFIDSSQLYHTNSVRSPIFYDSNDTTYYTDLASTSQTATRQRGGTVYGPNTTWGAYLLVGGNGRTDYINNALTASVVSTDGNLHLDAGSGKSTYLNWYDGNSLIFGNGSEAQIGTMNNSGDFTVNSSFRAPIFYDSNDTAYYADLASTSNFRNLLLNNQTSFNPTTPGLTSYGLTFIGGVVDYANGMTWTWSGTNAQAGVYVQSSGAYGTKMYFATTDSFATGSKTGMSMDHNGTVLVNRSYLQSDSSLRAPIFYDSNNTAYYVDPASTSVLNGLTVSGYELVRARTQGNWASTGVIDNVVGLLAWKNYGSNHVIFDASNGTTPSGTSCSTTNPQNNWTGSYPTLMGWNGVNTYGVRVDSARYADTVGSVTFDSLTSKSGGTGTYQTSGDFRAPIFYDSNNTGYYIDPTGTSAIDTLVTRGASITSAGHGSSYKQVELPAANNGAASGIVTMRTWCSEPGVTWDGAGFGYNVYNDGGTPNGFARANTSFGQAYMRMLNSGEWYFYNTNTSGTRITTMNLTPGGNVIVATDIRAPLFYDSNDTGYYVDPAATSKIARIWTGAPNGNGTAPRWDTSFYVMQSQHWYSHNGAQTMYVGEAGDFVYIRGYSLAEGSFRAPIFYDSNNTAYYIDAAGMSNLYELQLTGASNKYLYLNPGNGYEAMVRYNGGSGSGWYVGKRITGTTQAGTADFHFYSEAAGDTVAGIDTVGTFRAKGDVVAYSSSDKQLKDNIEPIENALEKVKQIGGYTFDWNDKQDTYKGHDVGIIAQEIEAVLPEVVITRDTGYKAVKYEKIVPLLIEAIKEQQTQIEELKELVNKLINKQ